MLVGYDKDWSPPGNKTSATYGNIFEGKYTFKLKAQSPEGVWSEPISYTFKVLPPWWRTWWMYALYATLFVGFIFLFVLWNNRRIISQKKILERKITVATKQIREEKEKAEAQKKETEQALKDLEAAEAQLIQSEKMASLGELTAGIAHEIQNPLNFVNNFSEVNIELIDEMQEQLKAGKMDEAISISKDIKENEEKISHHGKRAEGIVKGMLQHSRSSSGQKEATDINNLVDECLRLSFHGMRAKDNSFNAKTVTEFDESQPKISINPQDIGRVLLNLFTNSFYSVTQKRKQGIENYEPLVSVKTVVAASCVLITIRDNGNGIPQQALDKIFHPFFTTKPTGQGTGLGLSISYDIITKGHGGELKAETKEGEFAEFTIILPL